LRSEEPLRSWQSPGDHPAVAGVSGTCACHVRLLQHGVEAARRLGVAQRELGLDVVEDDAHPQRLGEHADLGPDVAVADDAQGLAARLVRAAGGLEPLAAVGGGVARGEAARSIPLASTLGDAGVLERRR
jgi:hypothetical protein